MDRETIIFENNGNIFELYAIPTIHEDIKIEDIAASFSSSEVDAYEKFRSMINTKDKLSNECAKRDNKGNIQLADTPGMYLLDTQHEKFPMYIYFKNAIESCYFYGKLKVLLVNSPENFDIDTISTPEFKNLRSAFEVALNTFQASARAA